MTRMWLINPTHLCDSHLLGEHKELHQLVGTIENHPHGEAILRGHVERGQVDTSRIQRRHRELVHELRRRGYNHESPLDYTDTLDAGDVDVIANQRDLFDRCSDCGPVDLSEVVV